MVAVGLYVLPHQLDRQENVIEHGAPRKQNWVLKHDPSGALRPYHLAALDPNRTARRLNKPGDHQHQSEAGHKFDPNARRSPKDCRKEREQMTATPNHALQRTPGFGVQLPSAAVVRPAQSRAVLPAMKPGTARAFALRRRAHSRAPGPESLSLGSLGD